MCFYKARVGFFFLVWLLLITYPVNSTAGLSGSVTGATDYFWRGYSKSNKQPVIQGNIDYEFKSGIYLGSFASTVNFGDRGFENRADIEFRPYLGWAHQLSDDWRFNVEWTRYIYNGKIFGKTADYNEFYFYGHFRDLLSANIGFSENSYQQEHMSFRAEMTGRYPITGSLEVSATVGYNKQTKILYYDYLYQSVGLTWYVMRNLGLDLRFYKGQEFEPENVPDVRWPFHPEIIDNRLVFSFTVGF